MYCTVKYREDVNPFRSSGAILQGGRRFETSAKVSFTLAFAKSGRPVV